jgi:ABC-type lipoprotein release transport system permease subunit
MTLLGVSIGLIALSAVATIVPAHRAGRVDPMTALRNE